MNLALQIYLSHNFDPKLSEREYKELIQKTNGASLFINRIERECQEVLIHLKEIATVLDGPFAKVPELTPAGETLKHVRFLVNSRECVFVRLRALQMRCAALLKLVRSVDVPSSLLREANTFTAVQLAKLTRYRVMQLK
jgi:hypothetical protein